MMKALTSARSIITPYGRYIFKRMAFGIKSTPEVFHKKNESIFGDTDSVEVIVDDIIVAAADEQEHAQIMVKLLQRAQEANVKFNTANFSTKSVKSSTRETSCLNQD